MNLLNIPKNIEIDLNINNYSFLLSQELEWVCIEILWKDGNYAYEACHILNTPLNDETKLKSLQMMYLEMNQRFKRKRKK